MGKKLLVLGLFLALLSFGVRPAFAGEDYLIPKDKNQQVPATIDWLGADSYFLSASSTPVAIVTEGCVVYGVFLSSHDATTDYVVLRDSATANISSTQLLPNIYFDSTTTPMSGRNIKFAAPINCNNGLSVNIGPATAKPTNCAVTIFYRKLRTGN